MQQVSNSLTQLNGV